MMQITNQEKHTLVRFLCFMSDNKFLFPPYECFDPDDIEVPVPSLKDFIKSCKMTRKEFVIVLQKSGLLCYGEEMKIKQVRREMAPKRIVIFSRNRVEKWFGKDLTYLDYMCKEANFNPVKITDIQTNAVHPVFEFHYGGVPYAILPEIDKEGRVQFSVIPI